MKKELDIFDKPKNVKIMLRLFFAVLIILLAADFYVHKEHSYFPWDGKHFFYAAFGFVACVMVITISKILRFFLMRDEDYYDD